MPGDYFSLIDDLNRKKWAREAGVPPEQYEAGILADRERLKREAALRAKSPNGKLRARPKSNPHRVDLYG